MATSEVTGVVDSTGTEEAPTVTVTVFADVTVTVAGPHSPLPLPPVASCGVVLTPDPPGPAGTPEAPALLSLVETVGIVTVEGPTAPVPVPVGPYVVELPIGYGADPVGPTGFPDETPEGTPPLGPYLG